MGRNRPAYERFQCQKNDKRVLEELHTRNPPVIGWIDQVLQLYKCSLAFWAMIPFLLDTYMPRESAL